MTLYRFNNIHSLKISNLLFMAAFLLLLLLFSAFDAVSAQQRPSTIMPGSSLTTNTNSTWLSPSGLFAFGFFPQHNGYAVGIFLTGLSNKTVVWTANTNNPIFPSDAILQLTLDGNLIVQQRGRQALEIVIVDAAIASASMLDSGNFVLYNNKNSSIWQSFDHPTNTILPSQRLSPPQELFSSASDTDYTRGIFRIKMQNDGNLVQYPVDTEDISRYAYWASETAGPDLNVSLNLGPDGHLYLLNVGSLLENLTEGYRPVGRTIYLFRIDVDGICRLYSHSLNPTDSAWDVKWATTQDNCQPKGFCGFNSFCFLMDNAAHCKCLPGFDFVQSGNETAGCVRNFTEESCGKKDFKTSYEIRREENLIGDDNAYETLTVSTEEGCKTACQGDCNCAVAFYKEGRCTKQRLPLRYGRRSQNNANIALIKVSIPTSGGVSDNSGKEIQKESRLDFLIIGIALTIVGATFLAISVIYVYRKRGAYNEIIDNGEVIAAGDVAPRAFSYMDLVVATNDFKEELGKGASGTVFKGFLHGSKKMVAVKRIEKECGGEKEFQREMNTIGKTYHRNLVRLLGYCTEGANRLLVLEYMSNGSLAKKLFNAERQPSWEDRINIARDIARGILYLHEECEIQIMHCDIKSQNILMDEHWSAKISDFGLAKLLKQDQTHQSNTYTGVRGTKGYVAPEWHGRQPITVKADVYSFGIVLLEIICCRKCIDWSVSDDEALLEEWVYDCYDKGELQKLVGDEIVNERKVERVVKIGLWSTQFDPSLRPSMKKILLMLEGSVDIPVPPNPTSFLSST